MSAGTSIHSRNRFKTYQSSPNNIPGLVLLLDSSVGVTASAGAVSSWADVTTGRGTELIQGVPELRPSVGVSLNGKPTIRFSRDYLYCADFTKFNLGTNSLLMYVVCSLDSGGSSGRVSFISGKFGHLNYPTGTTNGVGRYYIGKDNNNYVYGAYWTNGLFNGYDTIANFSTAYRIYMLNLQRVSTGTMTNGLYVHGRAAMTTTATDNKGNWVPNMPFCVGAPCKHDGTLYTSLNDIAVNSSTREFMAGNVAEVGLFQRDFLFRGDEITLINQYLVRKWGLSALSA